MIENVSNFPYAIVAKLYCNWEGELAGRGAPPHTGCVKDGEIASAGEG